MGLAAICAGWSRGGRPAAGSIQLPALLLGFPQATPVQILATNKLGSICGTSVSAVTYYRRVKPDLRTAIPLALLAFGGSLIGASLASHIPKAAFSPIILVVLIGVGTYTLLKPDLGQVKDLRFSGTGTCWPPSGSVPDRHV